MNWWQRRRVRKQLRHQRIPISNWMACTANVKLFAGLTRPERVRLRELATLLLQQKTFSAARDFTVTDAMRITIASQACLMILHLSLDYFDGWSEIIVYPGAFHVRHNHMDEYGLVHDEEHALTGESWEQGPLILSWSDIQEELHDIHLGGNVVIHEFAHKLDMLDGAANGIPELHRPMVREQWTRAMSSAFEHLRRQLDDGQAPEIDSYAATDPAEFFAVVSEYFFTAPRLLRRTYPEVYEQLEQFYRQDPVVRLTNIRTATVPQ
jgi:MtfA peptidase